MNINVVCSDTYIDAFSKLDKKTQKQSLDTIRFIRRSLKSDSLKIEKLNTKLNFKSARVTQDYRIIFTQSGNTVLLVYIDHHDAAYLWASNRLQGFDAANAKPVYEYFENSKKASDTITEETSNVSENSSVSTNKKPVRPSAKKSSDNVTDIYLNPSVTLSDKQISDRYTPPKRRRSKNWLMIAGAFISYLLGILTGLMIAMIIIKYFY